MLLLSLLLAFPADAPEIDVIWTTEIGPGFSSVAVSEASGFVTYRDPAAPEETVLMAFELASGDAIWRHSFPDVARKGQEDYGGGRGPHATPLVHRGVAIALGFGGAVHAVDAASGEPLWAIDLVEDLGAKPVQFGFAASPIAVGENVVIVTGEPGSSGSSGAGVTAFDARTGTIAWRSPGFEASYVTPVLTSGAGRAQLVCVTANETVAIDPTTGAELARTPHVRAGLTNFAMSLVLDTSGARGMLVSGQGTRGARRLRLDPDGGELPEAWSTRAVQFSHGRVLERNGFVYGGNGNVLCALDAANGALAFKVRGFGECGLVEAGDWVVALEEDGSVALLELSPDRIAVFARRALLGEKAWAAPTVVGDRVLVRDALRLVALRLPSRAEYEEPLEVIETGFVPGTANVPAARLAFAQGRYRRPDGTEVSLVTDGSTLALRIPGTPTPISLTPRSETTFEAADGTSVTLAYDDSTVPVAMELGSGERAERVAWDPVELDTAARSRVAGDWRVAEGVTGTIHVREDRLEAELSPYPGVLFAVAAESPLRLWLRATNAGYGIPEILLEVPADETLLIFHQGEDTHRATRR